MFDNFLEEPYHSWDKVFTHPHSGHSIFIGDVQSALNSQFIEQNKIGTVTAARDMDQVSFKKTIQHIIYPLLDGKQENITAFFDEFYSLVQKSISINNILVHCAAGISRSSTLVISYVMKLQHLTFRQAIAEIRKYRPSVLPNLGFQRQLKKYEESLKLQVTSFRGSKTTQFSECHQKTKTQLLPSFNILRSKKEKIPHGKTIGFNRIFGSEPKVLQISQNKLPKNKSKNKKFVITKKTVSFSKQPEIKQIVVNAIRVQPRDKTAPQLRKNLTSLEQMRQIYLNKGIAQRRNTNTERSQTFYNTPDPHHQE